MLTKTNIISAILLSVLATTASQENNCTLNDHTAGICMELPKCKSALRLVKNNPEQLKHLTCGFENVTPKVCCTDNLQDNLVFESSDSTTIAQTQPSTTPQPNNKVPRTTEHSLKTPTTTPQAPQIPHRFEEESPVYNPVAQGFLPEPARPRPPINFRPSTFRPTTFRTTMRPPTLLTRGSDLPDRSVCGQTIATEDRILGGTLASLGEFPWAALIKRGPRKSSGCMGTLINANYVITAAHCVEDMRSLDNVTEVRLGEWDRESDHDCDAGGVCSDPPLDVPVGPPIIHPNYTRIDDRIYNDIALLRLKEPVNYTDFVRPICLPTTDYIAKKDYLNSIMYTAAGWGKTEFTQSSVILRKVELTSVGMDVCRVAVKTIADDNVRDIICAGGMRGVDTCNGDSGSGLIKSETEEYQRAWFLYGITSYGPPRCGSEGIPGVYTRVTSYMGWIVDTISRN